MWHCQPYLYWRWPCCAAYGFPKSQVQLQVRLQASAVAGMCQTATTYHSCYAVLGLMAIYLASQELLVLVCALHLLLDLTIDFKYVHQKIILFITYYSSHDAKERM